MPDAAAAAEVGGSQRRRSLDGNIYRLEGNIDMRQLAVLGLMLLIVAGPSFAKTHKDLYSVPCSVLWPAVKDTLRNSGKYGILGIDNTEMTASFIIGSTLSGRRVNSAVLTAKGDSCEMQVQSTYSGLTHHDADDFKTRVDASLAQQQPSQPAPPAKPESPRK